MTGNGIPIQGLVRPCGREEAQVRVDPASERFGLVKEALLHHRETMRLGVIEFERKGNEPDRLRKMKKCVSEIDEVLAMIKAEKDAHE